MLKSKTYPHRGLSPSTLKKYNVVTKFIDGEPIETGFVYPNGAVKVRSMTSKQFRTHGQMRQAHLFGKDIFDKGSKPSITITEGEYDALSVYQITNGITVAVSVRSSSSAMKDCGAEFDYINSFDKIILAFDNDEQGERAAREVASLFDFNKVYKLNLSLHKDANEYLTKDHGMEFMQAWKACKRYTPDAIVSTFSDFQSALHGTREKRVAEYPISMLNQKLKGMHEQEVIVFKGDEGIGKTEIFRLLEKFLLENIQQPIGVIHLEESVGTAIQGLVSYHLKQPVNIDDGLITEKEVFDAFKEMLGGNENKIFFHDSYDLDEEHLFLDNIRFLVSVCGCKVILFDHISWLATGSDNEDERKKLDRISQRLKTLAKELKFTLIMISHVNDDGKTRGSRNITKVANTVIHMSRDKTAPTVEERNKLYLTVEKARLRGCETGPAGFLVFNPQTCNLEDVL